MAPDAAALESLESLVQTACALLQQLQDVLGEIRSNPDAPSSTPATTTTTTSSSSSAASPSPLDALALARDSATLIRAHATKVSLLIINEPFTPSAVSSVLRELVAGPIPGLVASVQACDPNGYTRVFRNELAWRCQRVLAELADLLRRVPKDGRVLKKEEEGFGGAAGAGGKGSIASTGVLWAACDKVVALANGGVGGFFVGKMAEWKDTLSDIMEEMKEWGDEEPDEDEDDDDDDDEDDDDGVVGDLADQVGSTHISAQNILDDLMSSHRSIPAADPDRIRPRLESSLRRLRLVVLLYQAITKRRMTKLPPFPPQTTASSSSTTTTTTTTNNNNYNNNNTISEGAKVPRRLDELSALLQKLPDRFGDLACAFYDLRPREIDEAMDHCFLDAFAVSELLGEGWDGQRDEFTEWTEKFQREIKKA